MQDTPMAPDAAGRNEPRLQPWPIVTACSVLLAAVFAAHPVDLAAATIPSYDRVRVLAEPRPIQDVELIDQDGEIFRVSQLRGRVALVFFGFTNCPDVCPMAMQRLREFDQTAAADIDDLGFVFVSVDSERDTPTVLKTYLEPFSGRFIGVTGNPEGVKALARQFSAAFFKENEAGEDGRYNVSHSPQVFALDPQVRLRAEFYNAAVEAMSAVVLALLAEHDQSPQ